MMTIVPMLSRWPLPIRRRLLLALWTLQLCFRWRSAHFGTDELVARSLRTGRGEARRIGRAMHFQDHLQVMEWLSSGVVGPKRFEAEQRYVTIEDAALFERIAATGEPVVLAPLHMGNISVGIAYVIKRFFAGRRVLVLRAREDRVDQNKAMDRLAAIASELRIVNTNDQAEFVDAMRFARKGAVVICFADLPASYGSPADVQLFGQPARIALGLDTLARLVKGVVVPLAVRSSVAGDVVMSGQAFEVLGSSAEERACVAALMSRQIERFIYAAPAQWHFWTRLHEFRLPDTFEGAVDGVA